MRIKWKLMEKGLEKYLSKKLPVDTDFVQIHSEILDLVKNCVHEDKNVLESRQEIETFITEFEKKTGKIIRRVSFTGNGNISNLSFELSTSKDFDEDSTHDIDDDVPF